MGSCSECEMPGDEEGRMKTLSCGHAYCKFCLFLVTRDQQGHMPCPSCRQGTLKSMVADSRYQQLSGTNCSRHGSPLTLYCLTCSSVICRTCTMLEHRSTHGHVLVDKEEESEGRFRDLFGALDKATNAHCHLSDTSASVLRVLKRNMDITSREIRDTAGWTLDKEHAEFRDFLDSELPKFEKILEIIGAVQKEASAAVCDLKTMSADLKATVENKKPARNSDVNYTKYIDKPLCTLGCDPVRRTDRLSLVMTSPPRHFADWLGVATGVLWALPKQILLVVDERIDGGEAICVYSFDANNLSEVGWSYYIKPTQCGVRPVLCQDAYQYRGRYLSECWIWIAVGNEMFQLSLDLIKNSQLFLDFTKNPQLSLDLQKKGCPVGGQRTFSLKLPENAIGVSAVACKFGASFVKNSFFVMIESTTNSLLSLYGWNGEHREDILVVHTSQSVTDIAFRQVPLLTTSLVICDVEAAIARSYQHNTFSCQDQYKFTLQMGSSDSSKEDFAVPISVTCNKTGDLLILWRLPELRNGDIVYSSWNITAHEQGPSVDSGRIFVVAAGNSLETGIPVGIDCWKHDVVICFKDGRMRVLKDFPILNDSASKWAGLPEVSLLETKTPTNHHRRSEELRQSLSVLTRKPNNIKSKMHRMSGRYPDLS